MTLEEQYVKCYEDILNKITEIYSTTAKEPQAVIIHTRTKMKIFDHVAQPFTRSIIPGTRTKLDKIKGIKLYASDDVPEMQSVVI